jgi:nitrite reductase/ring-hydroxylating ferredoxin subunit
MSEMIKVAAAMDVPPGKSVALEVGGRRIALFNANGAYYAIDDTCTHAGGPLSEGEVNGTEVTCPWHGACFDLASGEALGPPADDAVRAYKVQVDGDDILIEVP